MSGTGTPGPPAPTARPSSVTISSYLLYAVAAIQLLSAIVTLSVLGKMNDVYRDLYAGTSAEGAETVVTLVSVAGVVVGLLFAVGFVVVGVLNGRGRNASRITTWVLAGIGVCCTGIGVAGSGLGTSMGGDTGNGDVPSGAELQDRLSEVLPTWYTPLSVTLSVLALLALIAVIILLALPASNEFFRKPKPGFDPPIPGAAYPAYPPAPGYPATGEGPGAGTVPPGTVPPGTDAPGGPAPGAPPAHPQEPGPRTDRPDGES
ncbi:hypothetical protein CIK06_00755 [Plantactinospora sp. KBS50]|nr:hypothetical protein CIK06_00755 [Plantactinospora sp. KBS50]